MKLKLFTAIIALAFSFSGAYGEIIATDPPAPPPQIPGNVTFTAPGTYAYAKSNVTLDPLLAEIPTLAKQVALMRHVIRTPGFAAQWTAAAAKVNNGPFLGTVVDLEPIPAASPHRVTFYFSYTMFGYPTPVGWTAWVKEPTTGNFAAPEFLPVALPMAGAKKP